MEENVILVFLLEVFLPMHWVKRTQTHRQMYVSSFPCFFPSSLKKIRKIQIAEYEAHMNKQLVIWDMKLIFTELVCEF